MDAAQLPIWFVRTFVVYALVYGLIFIILLLALWLPLSLHSTRLSLFLLSQLAFSPAGVSSRPRRNPLKMIPGIEVIGVDWEWKPERFSPTESIQSLTSGPSCIQFPIADPHTKSTKSHLGPKTSHPFPPAAAVLCCAVLLLLDFTLTKLNWIL